MCWPSASDWKPRTNTAHPRKSGIALCVLIQLLLFCSALISTNTSARDIYAERADYQRARYAIQIGRVSEFQQLRALLADYPLRIYLDYLDVSRNIRRTSAEQAHAIREQLGHTTLGDRFYRSWLDAQVAAGNWRTYAANYERRSDAKAECRYLRALARSNEREKALKLTPELWIVGVSQPKECDVPFDLWIAEGEATPERVWRRIELSLGEGSTQLARYLKRFLPESIQSSADTIVRVHRNSQFTGNRHNFKNTHWERRAFAHGLKRLARSDSHQALQNWRNNSSHFDFDSATRNEIEDELWFWLAREGELPQQAPSNEVFSARTLSSIAISAANASDWRMVESTIRQLPAKEQSEPQWQYWRGVALSNLGDPSSTKQLENLAHLRHYYGFLAAQHLGSKAQLNDAGCSTESNQELFDRFNVRLIFELIAVGDLRNARAEWSHLALSLSDDERDLIVSRFAQIGLTFDAITMASRGKAQDVLCARFPRAFVEDFRRLAYETNIPVHFLFALTRQESAFNPAARSRVGALGLMQLMPATARATASRIRASRPSTTSLLNPSTNIKIGSHHVAELMEDFDDNRILAAVAYNAGPHRVRQWVPRDGTADTIVWIERIPFYETRSYVKNVLAYSHVYAMLERPNEDPGPLIREHEIRIPILSNL